MPREDVENQQRRRLRTKLQGDATCKIHVKIAALFTIAKAWKQPKCPSTDEWIQKMWYISISIYIDIYTNRYRYRIDIYNGILAIKRMK